MVLFVILVAFAAEIAAFVWVAGHIGFLLALILVLGISACGPILIRRAGTGVVEHARQRIGRGETPDREVLDGVVLLFGGVLVCIPGFIGDVVGLLLLIGPVRHALIRRAGHHLGRQVEAASLRSFVVPGRTGFRRPSSPNEVVVDASTHDQPATGAPRRGPADPDEPPVPR